MQYNIKAQLETGRGGDGTPPPMLRVAHFTVSPSVGAAFKVHISINWEDAKTIWGDEILANFVFRVEAMRQLKSYLDLDAEVGTIIDLSTERALTAAFRTTKYCEFLEDIPHKPACTIAAIPDDFFQMTTASICQANCELPDTDLICRHVAWPETESGNKSLGNPYLYERSVSAVRCNIGRQELIPDDISDCQLGKSDCWELIYTPPQPSQETSLDLLVDYVLSALDVLNNLFKDSYKHEPFKIRSFRASRDLAKPCTSQSDFTNNVSALAGILSNMTFNDLLNPPSQRQGTINHMEDFLVQHYPNDTATVRAIVQVMRDINTLRQQYPIHNPPDDRLIQAHKRLGIPFPIDNHEKAWYSIMQRFLDASRQLTALIT